MKRLLLEPLTSCLRGKLLHMQVQASPSIRIALASFYEGD